jgi:hypothetical protein
MLGHLLDDVLIAGLRRSRFGAEADRALVALRRIRVVGVLAASLC